MADLAEAARRLVGRREGVFTNPFASPLSAVQADRSSEPLVPVFLSEMERQDFESDVQEFVERIYTRQRVARSTAAGIRFSCVAGAASIAMCGVVDANIFGWESGKLASMLGAVLTLALVLNNWIGLAERRNDYVSYAPIPWVSLPDFERSLRTARNCRNTTVFSFSARSPLAYRSTRIVGRGRSRGRLFVWQWEECHVG
jgi:hypothetical protein